MPVKNQIDEDALCKYEERPKVVCNRPAIYCIEITTDTGVKCYYVGKTQSPKSRKSHYKRDVRFALEGKTKRPKLKKDGTLRKPSGLGYRHVILALVVAVQKKWDRKYYLLENCQEKALDACEQKWIKKLNPRLNAGNMWQIEDLKRHKKAFLAALEKCTS